MRYSNNTRIYNENIAVCIKRLNENIIDSIASAFNLIDIDRFYVINLDRRVDRKKSMQYEFDRLELRPHFYSAVDAESSVDVIQRIINKNKSVAELGRFDTHLTKSHLHALKAAMTPGAVAYKLSQRDIFKDAMSKGYQRICIFDDDVFFADFASQRLENFLKVNQQRWKVVALGASDYTLEKRMTDLTAIEALDDLGFYNPVPGRTCGSFAMMYDCSVFQEIIDGCDDAIGTFDNSVLGSLYARYPESCFVIFPNIVSPCVEDSDIRTSRDQLEQSRRMFWDISNFKRWVDGGTA